MALEIKLKFCWLITRINLVFTLANNCLKDKTFVKLLGRIRNVLLPILNILIICFNKCREIVWIHSCMPHGSQTVSLSLPCNVSLCNIYYLSTNDVCSFSLKASDIKQHTKDRAETTVRKTYECGPRYHALTLSMQSFMMMQHCQLILCNVSGSACEYMPLRPSNICRV